MTDSTVYLHRGFAQQIESNDVFSACDSRRKHKAWGASPRFKYQKRGRSPRERAKACKFHAITRFTGSGCFRDLILGLAPQLYAVARFAGLCLRLLRRLSDFLCKASS